MLKDERVLSAQVALQWVGISQVQQALAGTVALPQPVPDGALVIAISLTDSQGPFKLVLQATSVTVSILQVTTS